jgi:DeoR family fructose operon transcriptional repressor
MLKIERQNKIVDLLKKNEFMTLEECAELLGSSVSTVRRDFQELDNQGLVERVHGGAKILSSRIIEPSIVDKLEVNKEEKEKIAKRASEYVIDGDIIFLDAGSSTFAMIPFLKGKNVTVVTNGLTHIDLLIDYKIESYLIGGFIKPQTKALIGKEAYESIQKYHFNKCFMGTNGVDLKFGCSTPDPNEALIKDAVINQSDYSYVLADDLKFNRKSFVKFCTLDQSIIITNKLVAGYEEIETIEVV